jgi:iron complex outermembrane receptor protein
MINGHTLMAQSSFFVKGSVVDDKQNALDGASVYLYPSNKGAITDELGNFVIKNVAKGTYVIELSYVGYESVVDTINVTRNLEYNTQLNAAALNLQEVLVSDNYAETRKREESLNIEVVNDEYLKQNLGGSLMKSLERLPGVSTIDIGSGQSKPVIRGLSFNRVVVVENNIKHQAQQWGTDHGLEIDQYAIDNIEVVKGPASLMYGADAIGGVIDMSNRKHPKKNSFGGTVDLSAKSNNDFLGSSLSLYARKDWLYATVRATILGFGDYRVPTDSIDIYSYKAALYKNRLRNTAGNEKNFHLSFGVLKKHFQSKFYLSSVNSTGGFFANTHGLEPRMVDAELYDKSSRDIQFPKQEVNHLKILNNSSYKWGRFKVEMNLGSQNNLRQESSEYVQHGYMPATFPDSLGFSSVLEREFRKNVYTGNLKMHVQLTEKTQVNWGINNEYQDNAINGRGFIIPAYKQFNSGAYVYAKHKFTDKSLVQAGVRYDYGNISTDQYTDWYLSRVIINRDTTFEYLQRAPELDRDFSNFTWSIGYNYRPDDFLFKFNVGKSFRMPIAKELAANGLNYHRFSYEIGDPNLSPEISYQIDAGFEYHSADFAIGASPYWNHFSNYIFLNPLSEHSASTGAGNQMFEYRESELLRYGTEVHVHYEFLKTLKLGFIGEYVYSEQLSGPKKGFALPFSPPLTALFSIKYQKIQFGSFNKGYVSLDLRLNAAQDNIVPPEDPTEASQIINLGFGGNIKIGQQDIRIVAQVRNLLNTKYFNHTSYYRLINVPEAGRNFVININIPFSGKINKNK